MAEPLRKDELIDRPYYLPRSEPKVLRPPEPLRRDTSEQAFAVLRFGFTAAPIIAGLDKFFHVLVNWDLYLAPQVPALLGVSGPSFMQGVGVIEVIVGVGVALKPRIFAYVLCLWLFGIVGNLLIQQNYYDIALRDFGLALGAFALGRLASSRYRSLRSWSV